jgi:hypothetical protein
VVAASVSPQETSERVARLLDAHHYTDGLEFLRVGTPTHNTAEQRSGYGAEDAGHSHSFALDGSVNAASLANDSNGRRLAEALGLPNEALPSALGRVAGAAERHERDLRSMNVALWQVTWGYYLTNLIGFDNTGLTPADVAWARAHFVDHVRSAGPYAPIRCGRQPYGVLPVTSLDLWQPRTGEEQASANDTALKVFMIGLRNNVMRGRLATEVPRIGRRQDDPDPDADLADVMRTDAVSSSFDLDYEVNLGTAGDRTVSSIVETTVPAPVTFRGAPAPRHWEFEDARIEYGLLPVGPNDLGQLLMIECAGSYGNDWFVVPLTLPVGWLTSVDSLVVTDSFGVRTLLRPIGDRALPNPHWRMFQLAYIRRAGDEGMPGAEPNLLFLPPSLGRSLEGAALEDVLFMRDEMANLAWAIERSVESPIELASPRGDSPTAYGGSSGAGDAPPSAGVVAARYLLSSTVPANWIPLLRCSWPCRRRTRSGSCRVSSAAPSAGRVAAGPLRLRPCAEPRRQPAAVRRRGSAGGHPRDAPLSDGSVDRWVDVALGRASQRRRPRRGVEWTAVRSARCPATGRSWRMTSRRAARQLPFTHLRQRAYWSG